MSLRSVRTIGLDVEGAEEPISRPSSVLLSQPTLRFDPIITLALERLAAGQTELQSQLAHSQAELVRSQTQIMQQQPQLVFSQAGIMQRLERLEVSFPTNPLELRPGTNPDQSGPLIAAPCAATLTHSGTSRILEMEASVETVATVEGALVTLGRGWLCGKGRWTGGGRSCVNFIVIYRIDVPALSNLELYFL